MGNTSWVNPWTTIPGRKLPFWPRKLSSYWRGAPTCQSKWSCVGHYGHLVPVHFRLADLHPALAQLLYQWVIAIGPGNGVVFQIFVSSQFTIPKAKGAVRPILDLKILYNFFQVQKFCMESARSVIVSFRLGDLLPLWTLRMYPSFWRINTTYNLLWALNIDLLPFPLVHPMHLRSSPRC